MNKSGNLMVPTARLELAQPRSLPPQDSVSTNSTTSAKGLAPDRYYLLWNIPHLRTGILAWHLRRRCGLSFRRYRNLYTLKHASRWPVLLKCEIGKRQAGQEKQGGQHRGATAQKVGRSAGAKQAARRTASKCRTHVRTFALLQEHQRNQRNSHNNVYDPDQCFHA